MWLLIISCIACIAGSPTPALLARNDAEAGIVVSDGELDSFYVALGTHYQLPKTKVTAVRKRGVPDDQLPVVFFLARRAKVTPEAVVDLRLKDKSWMEVTLHLGLTAEVFHVSVSHDPGPPYGRALGHYKNNERGAWKTLHIPDSDVTHLVGLEFLASRHACSADAILKLHQKGDSLMSLHVRTKKHRAKVKVDVRGEKGKGRKAGAGSPKGKKKGKGKGKKNSP